MTPSIQNWEKEAREQLRKDLDSLMPIELSEFDFRQVVFACEAFKQPFLNRQKGEMERDRQERFEETNISRLIEEMEKDAEEYGDLHAEFCPCNMEDPDECDCDNMKAIKAFGREWMAKVNEWWVVNAMAHRKHCTPEGNKVLTRLMGKKNRNPLTALKEPGE